MIVVLLGVVAAISCICFGLWHEKQTEKKYLKKLDKERMEWVSKQASLPLYRVQAFTKDKNVISTDPFIYSCKTEFSYFGHDNYYNSSLDQAEWFIKKTYERGYFLDKHGATWPVCNICVIEKVKV